MSRQVKEMIVENLGQRYSALDGLVVISMHGLKGVDANRFRGELRNKGVEVHIVKNRLARRALEGTSLATLASSLKGPCAFVTGQLSPVETAKELLNLKKEFPALELRFGAVDGEADVLSFEQLSVRKGRMELLGEVLMAAISPGRRIAGCLNAGGRIAGCVKAIVDKLEKGEAIQKVA